MTNIKENKWQWSLFQIGLIILGLIALTPILLYGAYTIFLWVAHDYNPHFRDIDVCLDLSGRWDYEINDCEGSESYKKWKENN